MLGGQRLPGNSKTGLSTAKFPKKSIDNGELSSSDKKSNRELARKRIVGENVNRKRKIFKKLAEG